MISGRVAFGASRHNGGDSLFEGQVQGQRCLRSGLGSSRSRPRGAPPGVSIGDDEPAASRTSSAARRSEVERPLAIRTVAFQRPFATTRFDRRERVVDIDEVAAAFGITGNNDRLARAAPSPRTRRSRRSRPPRPPDRARTQRSAGRRALGPRAGGTPLRRGASSERRDRAVGRARLARWTDRRGRRRARGSPSSRLRVVPAFSRTARAGSWRARAGSGIPAK